MNPEHVVREASAPSRHGIRPYVELTKPRIVTMVLVTTCIGFFLGGRGIPSWVLLLHTVFGTLLTSAGASALNQYLERDADALMRRTMRRPLCVGSVSPANALGFGTCLVLVGTAWLVVAVNLLTGFLALLTCFLYVLVYTPLKRTTWLNTFVGAVPGALPPVGGWAAAAGDAPPEAWILFLILFLWQHPHFYAIAWMYKEDYGRGGFKMLPVIEPDGRSTFRQVVIYSVLLVPASVLPTYVGMSGVVYSVGAFVSGVLVLAAGVAVARSRSVSDARRLLRVTVVYLPVLLGLIVADVRF